MVCLDGGSSPPISTENTVCQRFKIDYQRFIVDETAKRLPGFSGSLFPLKYRSLLVVRLPCRSTTAAKLFAIPLNNSFSSSFPKQRDIMSLCLGKLLAHQYNTQYNSKYCPVLKQVNALTQDMKRGNDIPARSFV